MKSRFNFRPQDIAALQRMVGDAERIVLTCHVAPDGDAMGSTLGLCRLLQEMGKRAAVITPDVPTHTLAFLPGAGDIIPATRYSERAKVHLQAADLLISLDFNTLMRVDKLQPLVEGCNAPKILIDHHIGPDSFANLIFSYPESSSTCYLLYELIKAAGWECFMQQESAECIYCGMMTDTGNFSFNSNDPGLYVDIARLLEYGIDKDRIYKLACDTSTVDRLKLNAFAICEKMKVYPEDKCAIITLTREELKRYNYSKGDTEGLVNKPLKCPDIVYSAFLREDEGFVKVSMRSKGDFPVNRMCEEHFGGGGHKNAAGGELRCSLQEAVKIFEEVMPHYRELLND